MTYLTWNERLLMLADALLSLDSDQPARVRPPHTDERRRRIGEGVRQRAQERRQRLEQERAA